MKFWTWLFRGDGDTAGIWSFVNRWLTIQILAGLLLAALVPLSLSDAADQVFLPLVGILVGLSFAWGGSANVLLQSEEVLMLSEQVEGGLQRYVFLFQLAILSLFVTLSLWGLAALELFDGIWPTPQRKASYFCAKALIYTASVITLRECWHVIMGVQALLLAKIKIQARMRKNETRNSRS